MLLIPDNILDAKIDFISNNTSCFRCCILYKCASKLEK